MATQQSDRMKQVLVFEIEQYRHQANMQRVPVSQAIQDIVKYCHANSSTDPFLNPVRENPFKEKRSCSIL